jgi:hypothetical protein
VGGEVGHRLSPNLIVKLRWKQYQPTFFKASFLLDIMNSKLVVFIALLASTFFVASVDARFPQPGDHVQVLTTSGKINVHVYEGEVTEIHDGLLCMNCTKATTEAVGQQGYGMNDLDGVWYMDFYPPCDVCIGTGQIIALVWVDDSE